MFLYCCHCESISIECTLAGPLSLFPPSMAAKANRCNRYDGNAQKTYQNYWARIFQVNTKYWGNSLKFSSWILLPGIFFPSFERCSLISISLACNPHTYTHTVHFESFWVFSLCKCEIWNMSNHDTFTWLFVSSHNSYKYIKLAQ